MSDIYKPLKEGYEFNGNEYFKKAWELFKKEAGSFIGATIIFFVIYIIIAIIPIINIFSSVLLSVLLAGYFVFLRNMKSETHKMGDFFGGFKYFGQILLYLISMVFLVVPVAIALFLAFFPYTELMASIGDVDGMLETMTLLFMDNLGAIIGMTSAFYAYMFYLTISFLIAIPLIVDAKLGFWQAMGLSRKVVGKKFFSFLGFYILIAIGSLVFTVLTLGFGLLVIIPFYYVLIWVVYDNIFKFGENEVDEIEDFGQATNDINTESQEKNMGH